MTPITMLIVTIICIAACVYFGNKFDINIGILALPIVYILGVFFLGKSSKDLVGLWPTSTMITVIALCLFFGYINESGATQKLAELLLYKSRNFAKLMPFTILFISVLLTATGANPFAVAAICCPLVFSIAAKTGKRAILGFAMFTCGTNIMCYLPWSSAWAVQTGVIESGALAAGAGKYMYGVMAGYIVFFLLCAVILFIVYKGTKYMSSDMGFEKPEPFTKAQRLALTLVFLFILVVVIPTALGTITGSKDIKAFAKKIDVGYLALVFAAISALLKLGNTKKVINKQVPWTTIVMICGVGMLINLAADSGAVATLGEWIGSSVPKLLIGPALFAVGGVLSMFVSTNNVAIPTLFAMVPSVVASAGLNPALMYICIAVGCSSTGCFPFSGSGSFALAVCQDERLSGDLFKDQMKMAFLQFGLGIVLSFVLCAIL